MLIFSFGKVSGQTTIVNQGGWKMLMPFPITLSNFIFFAFLTSHGCVFGYDQVEDNHRVVLGSIRGTNAAMVKLDGNDRDRSMIKKLVKVGGDEKVPIQSINSSGERDMNRIHNRRLDVWSQRGFDIDGEAALDESGSSVAVSDDGRIVAIGARLNYGVIGSNKGHTRVFNWNGTAYVQRGIDIDGEATDDESGTSVLLSNDGNVLAVGAPKNSAGRTTGATGDKGLVRVYTWNNTCYVQRGSNIDGVSDRDESGTSISLSGNGLVLAIGAPKNDADTDIDCDGQAVNEESGTSVSLSYRGFTLAVGAPKNDYGATSATVDGGRVRVYTWDGVKYTQQGTDIVGETESDLFGKTVSLSANGRVSSESNTSNNGVIGGIGNPSLSVSKHSIAVPFHIQAVNGRPLEGTGSKHVSQLNTLQYLWKCRNAIMNFFYNPFL
ncbi:hypothetical protein ACHAW5_003485 [Stephanodiscus triporus]|uniref:Uncharacterized protein n=1 Tax=Stephanodiscus triporus TaxID=2934178 RepID=A0ABD3QEF4_9STRA